MGLVISFRQLNNLVKIVDEAASQGVSILCGGKRMAGKSKLDDLNFDAGFYFPPTVLHDGPTAKILDTRLWREEAFGPVIVVVGFGSEDEAVELANDSEFGLGAALWTTDLSQAFRVSEQIESGIVWGRHHSSSNGNTLADVPSKYPSSKRSK
jgi:acyl-CoA reductase-like NAD-dependent aldehyde dehydrogenase